MAKKLACRYVVQIGGQLKRLFSIRESSSGDLLITTHFHQMGAPHSGGVMPLKEMREALHVSPASPDTTLHGITVYEDGSAGHRYLVSSALRSHRFDAIYIRTVPSPESLPSLSGHPKGDVIQLPTYDPRICTMHYGIWFGATEDAKLFQDLGYYSAIVSQFKHFSILIPFCFSPEPSQPISSIFNFTSTSPEKRSAAHIAEGIEGGPSEGVPPSAMAYWVVYDFNRLVTRDFSRKAYEKSVPPPREQTLLFQPGPIGPEFFAPAHPQAGSRPPTR